MSRFRVGDVCEIVDTCCAAAKERCGVTECTIVAEGRSFLPFTCASCGFSTRKFYVINTAKYQRGHAPEKYLRLRRPPSWDTWLYETEDVERDSSQRTPERVSP